MNKKIRKYNSGGAVSTDDIIDPDEVMFDGDTGLPVPNDDGSDFTLAGNAKNDGDDPAPKKNDPPKKSDPPAPDPVDPIDPADDPADGDDPLEDPAEEPVNHADYVLRNLGYTQKQVDLGDGVVKDVADLTDQEQLDVVTARLEKVMGFYETQLDELKNGTGAFTNDVEKAVIQTLRENDYNLADLAKIISENDPSAVARTASNEELVTMHLRNMYPDITDEELQEELEGMAGTSRFDRIASLVRENLSKKDLGESDFAKAIQKLRETTSLKESNDYKAKRTELIEYTKNIEKFGEIPLSQEIKDFVMADIDSDAHDKNSPFLDSLDKPDRLFRLSFLDKFHEQILENTANYYFELGKKEAQKIVGKFRETPEVIKTGTRFKKGTSAAQSKGGNKQEEETF